MLSAPLVLHGHTSGRKKRVTSPARCGHTNPSRLLGQYSELERFVTSDPDVYAAVWVTLAESHPRGDVGIVRYEVVVRFVSRPRI